MISLNLFFFKHKIDCLSSFSIDAPCIANNVEKSSVSVGRNSRLVYIFNNLDVLSDTRQNIAKKKIIKQNIGRNFCKDLWGQDIFLSINSKLLKKYDAHLNSLSMNNRQNMHKSLVSKFSKSLFNGSIQVSFLGEVKDLKDNFSSIQYIWAKSVRSQVLKFSSIFYNGVNRQNIKNMQTALRTNINVNHLPLFTISNNLGQMIISEPPTDLNISAYVEPYSSLLTWNGNMYHGFFFTNYEDAQEYMLYIERCYNLENSKLRIFTCNFNTFYKIIDKFNRNICFRLVPDLKEVGELIKRYRYYRNVSFHKRQQYSKNYFQGQPLYIVKGGTYISSEQASQKYYLAFTNYNDAVRICNRLKNLQLYSSASKLSLVVYNLENLIQDQLKLDNHSTYPLLVIPSKTSYLFTKDHQLKNNQQLLYNYCLDTISFISLWSKRILWSLTSRKPEIYC